jgi:hypothetical protein
MEKATIQYAGLHMVTGVYILVFHAQMDQMSFPCSSNCTPAEIYL